MRNRRRTRVLRRLVLGLAVAAMVAPGAQAALDEGNTVRSESDQSGVVIKGDDKTFAAVPDGGIMLRGDDKVLAPAAPAALVAGERFKAPELGSQYTQAGYRRALPQDTVLPGGIIRGEHYVPATGQYGGYVRAMPSDVGSIPGRQPVQVTSEPSGFDLRDGLFAAMAALGLALLAFGAMLISRHSGRPETA